ncbi:hypothetical protein R3P38DRAFT_3576666 [Favolaschia claudopus]|uniref:F-box domain-containing protein n=1 Tax=Favolaschia claudopus TaxID=2862362 RepID=A0AAW0DPE0_9AGAR
MTCNSDTKETVISPHLTTATESDADDLRPSGPLPPCSETSQPSPRMAATEIESYDVAAAEMQKELGGGVPKSSSVYHDEGQAGCDPTALVHQLPNELLSEIFDLCSPDTLYVLLNSDTLTKELDRISQRHLLQLSQVCSRWYHVAMETPKLWSTVTVSARLWDSLDSAQTEILLSLLKTTLDRGGDHPLTLTVCTHPFNDGGERALELFVSHAHRWRVLNILPTNDPPECLRMVTGKLECLETLMFDPIESDFDQWKDVECFRVAPRLTNFKFRGLPGYLPQLPWNQITNCTHYEEKTFACLYHPLSILRCAAPDSWFKLVLDLRRCCANPDEPWNLDISSDVRHLQIWFGSGDSATTAKLLDSLTLPHASFLSLSAVTEMGPSLWACNHFLRLAHRSQFDNHLLHLSICQVIIRDTELLQCLEVLPRLQSLDLVESVHRPTRWGTRERAAPFITDKFLLALVHSPNTPALIPNLEDLRLVVTGWSIKMGGSINFSPSVLVDMLVSRVHKIYDVEGKGAFAMGLTLAHPFSVTMKPLRELYPSLLHECTELIFEGKLIFNLR